MNQKKSLNHPTPTWPRQRRWTDLFDGTQTDKTTDALEAMRQHMLDQWAKQFAAAQASACRIDPHTFQPGKRSDIHVLATVEGLTILRTEVTEGKATRNIYAIDNTPPVPEPGKLYFLPLGYSDDLQFHPGIARGKVPAIREYIVAYDKLIS